MPVSRDRLSRPVDISTLLPNAQRRVNLTVDEPGLRLRGLSSQNASISKSSSSAQRLRRRSLQAQRMRMRQQRHLNRLPVDQENQSPFTGQQRRRSLLPSWHPRTPLRDVTAIVRAIERRRAELQGQRTEAAEQEANAASSSTVQPETETNIVMPAPTMALKSIETVTDENAKPLEGATPEKQLLNSIDKVRQIWVEEQERVEKTPAAKRAERARKVRTLMSMR